MPADIWLTEDIHRIILAAVRANHDALTAGLVGSDPWRRETYQRGFRAALSTLSVALGLPALTALDDEEERVAVESSVAGA